MSTFRHLTNALQKHKPTLLRTFINHNKHSLYKNHFRLIHLNVLRTRINFHHTHIKRLWPKYTLLISLSTLGITLSHYKLKQSNVSAKDTATDDEIEPETDIDEAEQKRLDEEAIAHLIKTITVPTHSWFVWIWLYFARFMFLIYNFTPVIMLAPYAYFNTFGIREYWLNLMHDRIANGGSTFIKLGQWISMRSDIFPIEICDHLSELRMRAPEHSFEDTCQVIKDAFGREIDDIFDRFYISPTASGSIAQVHKAQICINATESCNYFDDDMYEGNRGLFEWFWDTFITRKQINERQIAKPQFIDVAVKVRHPNILQNMYIDISIMYMLSNFISSLPGLQGLKFPIHQKHFTQYLESQIDLSYEGKSLQKMYKNFEKYNDDKSVIFPKVIEELSTSSVLVESWEYGVPLCNLDLNKLTNKTRHTIAKRCYDIFMKMALRDNFVHGDCHSGNILIRAVDVTDDDSASAGGLVSILKDKTEKLSEKLSETLENTNIPIPIIYKSDRHEKLKRDIEGPLIFLDAGLTASLTNDGHKRFGVMMGHIATAKCKEAAEIFGSWAVMNEEEDPLCFERRDRFVNKLSGIIHDGLRWRQKDSDGNVIPNKGIPFIAIGPLLRNVLILTQKEHITLDSSFSAVIASLGIIEGLIKTLDPSADFLAWGVPYLIKYRKLDSLKYLVNN